jgi:hypothetical protein
MFDGGAQQRSADVITTATPKTRGMLNLADMTA